jgi:Uncharacterized protein conserved in bacteria (DUF2252).
VGVGREAPAASFAIAGRGNGFSRKEREAAVLATARSYRKAMTGASPRCAIFRSGTRAPDGAGAARLQGRNRPEAAEEAEADLAKARTRDSMFAYEKLTHLVDGEPRIISDPPLIVPMVKLFPRGSAATRSRARCETCSAATGRTGQRPARLARSVPLRRPGPQGGRGRERRHPRLDRPLPGRRQPGSPLPPNQGGAVVGARAVRGQERVSESRPAGRRRAAVNAGRHDIFIGWRASGPPSTGRNGTSTCAN